MPNGFVPLDSEHGLFLWMTVSECLIHLDFFCHEKKGLPAWAALFQNMKY